MPVTANFIALLEQQAEVAAVVWAQTGRIRVLVLDNGSIHKSKAVEAKLDDWQAQGFYLFFLRSYCLEMKQIR